MIYKARHHWFIYHFFQWYTKHIIGRYFRSVKIMEENTVNSNLPILLISNHFSWWDGFFACYINSILLHRRFHVMMQEEHLLKHFYFNKSGAFSIKKHSRSIIETINYTSDLLSDKKNMVTVFPQGEIQSAYTADFHFEKGTEKILQKVKNTVLIVFSVCLIEYFSHKKPTLYIYTKCYEYKQESIAVLQEIYNSFYKQCRKQNRNKTNN